MGGGGGGPSEPGIGGGGGAPPAGIGGGGGAPPSGIGGGGGAPPAGMGGGGGGEAGEGDVGLESLFSMADIGRGGAMVPNRIDASCLALPPVGPWSSSSSSSLDSTTDQSSSSEGLARERPEGAGSGRAVLFSAFCMLWNGL